MSTELLSAAAAVIERWDSPVWKDLPATAEVIDRLRKAVALENGKVSQQEKTLPILMGTQGGGKGAI